MSESTMCLHCGGKVVTLDEVAEVKTPEPEGLWHPIPHMLMYERVVEALTSLNLRVAKNQHALSHDGNRWFGLLDIANGKDNGEYCYSLGLRNTHDRSFAASLAAGSHVFVCDNLSFNAEIVIARKHTTHIERDLPILTGNAVGRLVSKWVDMDTRFDAYKKREISEERMHDLTIRALDVGAITLRQIPEVIDCWRNPRHQEFSNDRTAWKFFNAVTEVSKETNIFTLPRRTQALHGLIDAECGIAPPSLTENTSDAEVTTNN